MNVPLNVSPHSARKTYAVELRKEEGLAAVQSELQHNNMSTTMLYAFADLAKAGKRERIPESGDLIEIADVIAEKVANLLVERLHVVCPYLGEKKKDTN